MKLQCCKNCFYLTSKVDKDYPLSDYHTVYGCKLHNLTNGEVRWPNEQRCDSWTSIISGQRNKKLEELEIN
jgi:hypothetical protein